MTDWEQIRKILIKAAADSGSPDPEDAAQNVIVRVLTSYPTMQFPITYFWVAGRNEAKNQIRRVKVRRGYSYEQERLGTSYSRSMSDPHDMETEVDLKIRLAKFLTLLRSPSKHKYKPGQLKKASISDLVFLLRYIDMATPLSSACRVKALRSRSRLKAAYQETA